MSNHIGKDALGRPRMLALYGFPACVLQVYFKDVRVGEMLEPMEVCH